MGEERGFRFTALTLCALLFLVYGLQIFFHLDLAYRPGVDVYRFFTSIFAHSGVDHLINNVFFIGMFGTIYELYTSSRTFLATFLVSAIAANLTAFVFYPQSFILGASAGAMGVLGALAVYKPRQIGLGLGVPMPMWAVLIVYLFINMVGIGGANAIANEAHLAGLFVGALIGYRLREPEEDHSQEDNLGYDNWEERIRRWEEKWMK